MWLFKRRRLPEAAAEEENNFYRELCQRESLGEYIRGSLPEESPLFSKLRDPAWRGMPREELVKHLLEGEHIEEEELFKQAALYNNLTYSLPDPPVFSEEVLEAMKKLESSVIERYRIIVHSISEKRVRILTASLVPIETREVIRSKITGVEVDLLQISKSSFERLYSLYQDKLSIMHEIHNLDLSLIDESRVEIDDLTNEDNPIVKLVDNLLSDSVRLGASDIHIEPYKKALTIKKRIDGVLIEDRVRISREYHEPIISRIKILSRLNIAEQRVPQDGRLKKFIGSREVDFRVSILPTAFGESAVIRVLDKKEEVLTLEALGASQDERGIILQNASLPYGMVLVTGPTGSGKTTTLYAILNEIYSKEEKVITIEDPVEYQLEGVVQIPVNEKAGLTFAKGLRSILRQDPDKIMVGEIRDRETAEIAIQAALTGHLVISTLHANNTVEAIGRLTNIGVDPFQFATALNLVIGQRLVRKVCRTCMGKGCSICSTTGYQGRSGVYELFQVEESIKDMIIQGVSPIKIKEQALIKGMIDLKNNARRKVRSGITTVEEYERVIGGWSHE